MDGWEVKARELAWMATAILAAGIASAGQIPAGILTIGSPSVNEVRFGSGLDGAVKVCVEMDGDFRCTTVKDLREMASR